MFELLHGRRGPYHLQFYRLLTHLAGQKIADAGGVRDEHQAHAEMVEVGFRLLFHGDGSAPCLERPASA